MDTTTECGHCDCLERAEIAVSRSSRSRSVPLCERHLRAALVQAERYRYALVLTQTQERDEEGAALAGSGATAP